MKGNISFLLIVLFATKVISLPEGRIKRSYNKHEHSGLNGYGMGREERVSKSKGIASIEDHVPCGLFENSGSPEYGYDPHERPDHGYHKGTTSVKAAAAAFDSSYS